MRQSDRWPHNLHSIFVVLFSVFLFCLFFGVITYVEITPRKRFYAFIFFRGQFNFESDTRLHQSLFDNQATCYAHVQSSMPWAAVKLTALKLQLNQLLWNKPKEMCNNKYSSHWYMRTLPHPKGNLTYIQHDSSNKKPSFSKEMLLYWPMCHNNLKHKVNEWKNEWSKWTAEMPPAFPCTMYSFVKEHYKKSLTWPVTNDD